MTSPYFRRFLSSITVEPVLLLFMTGSQMEYGVYQDLLYQRLCLEHYNYDTVLCNNLTGDALDYVQTQTSYWLQYNNIALMVPAIISAFYLGSWGDRYGRKVPLLLANFSTLLGYLILVIMATYEKCPAALTLLSNFVCGLGGGYLMVMASVNSYISDITSNDSRTTRLAVLESMSVLGDTVGPLLSGYLLEGTSYGYTFLFCIACNTVVIFYIVIRIKNVIPVSEQPDQIQTQANGKAENGKVTRKVTCDNNYICEGITSCFRKRDGKIRMYIMFLLVSCLFVFFASDAESDLTYLYVKDDPLSWDYKTYTQYSSLKNCIGGLMLLIIVPLIGRFLGLRDTTLALCGLFSRLAGLLLLAFSTNSVMMFMVPVVAMFSWFPVPCFRSMLSKLVDVSEQGKMFSMISTIENLVMMLASVLYNNMYPATRSILHGFCFLFAACIIVIPISLISWIHIDQHRSGSKGQEPQNLEGQSEVAVPSNRDTITE